MKIQVILFFVGISISVGAAHESKAVDKERIYAVVAHNAATERGSMFAFRDKMFLYHDNMRKAQAKDPINYFMSFGLFKRLAKKHEEFVGYDDLMLVLTEQCVDDDIEKFHEDLRTRVQEVWRNQIYQDDIEQFLKDYREKILRDYPQDKDTMLEKFNAWRVLMVQSGVQSE